MRITEFSIEKLLEGFRAKRTAWRKRCVPFFEAAVLKIKNAVDDARGKIVRLSVRNMVLAAAAGLAARARNVFTPVTRFLKLRRERLWFHGMKPAFLRGWKAKPGGPVSRSLNGFRRVPVVVVWLIATVAIAGLARPAVPVHAYAVKDPNASYFDVSARREFLRQTESPVLRALMAPRSISECEIGNMVQPVRGQLRLPPYYRNSRKDERNPKWRVAAKPFFRLHETVGDIARLYVISGDPAYARCLVAFLDRWARVDALTDVGYSLKKNRQAWYTVTWAAVDAGLAYSIVRGEASLDPAAKKRVEDWLHRVVSNNIRHPGAPGVGGDCCNNISYWRGLLATVVGVVTNDSRMFDWGISTFRQALKDMNVDGSFPGEMGRRKAALRYQQFATLPLVLIAEVAARQGYDLYSLEVGGRSLHTAAAFSAAAVKDRSLIKKYTNEKQRYPSGRGLSWAEAYYRRFPKPELAEFVGKANHKSDLAFGGALPLYFYTPEDPPS